MTEGLTKTRPSPSTPAGKTRQYVQAAAGRACTGVLLCLQACRQSTATRSQKEGRHPLLQPPQGMWPPLVPAPCPAAPGAGCAPRHRGARARRRASAPPFLPLSRLLGASHLGEAHRCRFTLSFSRHCVSDHLETLSTAGLPPRHVEQMNKDAERMNVTVSAVTESASAAPALGNLQRLLPQLASKRHGRGKRRCRLSPVPCISASLYENQREQPQGPSSHFTVLLSYPNIIHCQSCFSWQDKPSPPLPCYTCTYRGKTTESIEYNNMSQTL